MKSTTIRPNGNTVISPMWALDALRTVRDALQSLPLDKLADGRDALALAISEAIGGLAARRIEDGIDDDFEDLPGWDDDARWTLSLPPITGGAPFEPSDQDWLDYFACRDDSDPLTEADVIAATGAY